MRIKIIMQKILQQHLQSLLFLLEVYTNVQLGIMVMRILRLGRGDFFQKLKKFDRSFLLPLLQLNKGEYSYTLRLFLILFCTE